MALLVLSKPWETDRVTHHVAHQPTQIRTVSHLPNHITRPHHLTTHRVPTTEQRLALACLHFSLARAVHVLLQCVAERLCLTT